jgi:hypothetical protein
MYDDSKVSYDLEVFEDCTDVRGNAMSSGDDDFDKEVEDAIFERLDNGDVWAWALVKVTATYEGRGCVGVDYLGCCNYLDEEDFVTGGLYDEMKAGARRELYSELYVWDAQDGRVESTGDPACND